MRHVAELGITFVAHINQNKYYLTPQQTYNERVSLFKSKSKLQKSKLLKFSFIRIAVFLLAVLGIYLYWSKTAISIGIGIVFCVLFMFLIRHYLDLKREKIKLGHLITINENELIHLSGKGFDVGDGEIYKDSTHAYSEDIDLFGKKSFFQFLNRTGIKTGEQKLAELLKSNETSGIIRKQEAIKELSLLLDFRQDFTAEAMMLEDQNLVAKTVKRLESYSNFSKKWIIPASYVFSLISVLVLIAFSLEYLSLSQFGLWIMLGLGITGFYIKKINALSRITSSAQENFRQYQKLISAVENQVFSSQHLLEHQNKLKKESFLASTAVKKLSKHIDALEQRQNMLVGVVLNALTLWDLRQSKFIEDWLDSYKTEIRHWFEVIDYIDAQNSFANLAFNQPGYTYPIISKNNNCILECADAAHPLIKSNQVVTNSFSIKEEDFLIVTGANMAGKSTFLRTVSLMIVMANNGLPVYANTCHYTPIQLITSMRTSDSLSDESSYFFAELSRLKVIIDNIAEHRFFIVLDEILKGTNSHDKAKGSRQFVEKLVKSKSSGIIATHDLSLCTLEEKLASVKNYYFDAEIINEELHFDYKFKKGVCKNMNASFLLKKMGIV